MSSAEDMTVTIKDIGPVVEHQIHLAPGVTVLTGDNEVGKSTCIMAVAALAGRDSVDLSVRDSAKNGLVSGLGVVLQVGRSTRRMGDLEIDTLEDRLDISKLVNPGVKEAKPSNSRRIKALMSLTGTRLALASFATILPDSMQNELLASDEAEDPVEMAAKIKRRMEAKAREYEEKSKQLGATCAAARERLRDQDLATPHDAAKLQRRLLDATSGESRLLEQRRAADEQAQAIADANRRIAETESTGAAQVNAAEAAYLESKRAATTALGDAAAAQSAKQQQAEEVARIKALLTAAETDLHRLTHDAISKEATAQAKAAVEQASHSALETARGRIGDLEQLRQLANRAAPDGPDEADLEAAREERESAAAAIERGAIIRDLLAVKAQLDLDAKEHLRLAHMAEVFRNAARGTDDVLSSAVACETLKVIEGELCYVDGNRKEAYARLSDGKRWQVAITEVSRTINKTKHRPCVLPVQQEAWEGLTDHNRRIIAEAAQQSACCIVTAEKGTHGEALRSYHWEGNGHAE